MNYNEERIPNEVERLTEELASILYSAYFDINYIRI